MNRLYETMTRVQANGLTVRVWCSTPSLIMGPDHDVLLALRLGIGPFTHEVISAALDKLPNVTAYEILDAEGNGGIVYPDWK